MLHALLTRQLKRAGLDPSSPPTDSQAWQALLGWISHAYTEADQDRYLLERSLSISSDEMRGLHERLAAERDTLRTVIGSLHEGLCALDGKGCILFINSKAESILALSNRTVLGQPLAALVDLRDESGRLMESFPPESTTKESRLIVGGEKSVYIMFTTSPLAEPRDGVLLTLCDATERKRAEKEKEETQQQLVELSRRAGMAEVATNVLHNVGNVLNSVNVSATVVADKLRHSQVSDLVEVTELMQQRAGDLGTFITNDERGKLLPHFLFELGKHLVHEQDAVLQELESLTTNIGHIKDIVNTQQSYAKVSGVMEEVRLAELVDTALRLNSAAMERHKVRVVREYEKDALVLVDKHKVLQILVNLISNAKYAVESVDPDDRRMTVRIGMSVDRADVIQIVVIDNGEGIPRENLTRIFAHGFTTKKNGHGFGLHGSALSAKEMGGTLTAHSDGPDRGATFTLEIPLNPAEMMK
ncbi:MAG: ATP-binding protein [Planctomycetota bacterium]